MLDPVIRLRHQLHRRPELSGEESETARTVAGFFRLLAPDAIIENLGGTDLAIVFAGAQDGPTVLFRCELDALPIEELNDFGHRSIITGVSHKCGHDGHMAILAAVGMELATRRPGRGKVVLLFQPAEETGAGAAAVVQDPVFASIKPDLAFALHNLPGFPLGTLVLRDGVMTCASRGMTITLSGSTAHAAQPETGKSPALAMCQVIEKLSALPPGLVPAGETAFVTVVGSKLGDKAFGTAPGQAEIWATLRSETDATMSQIVAFIEDLGATIAAQSGLEFRFAFEDIFRATINSKRATDLIWNAVSGMAVLIPEKPFRWSEDFGQFTAMSDGALFGIGAGEDCPPLHDPNYDFPDTLIPVAADIIMSIIRTCLD